MKSVSNPWAYWGRVGLYFVLLIWGWKFILMDIETNEIGESFWHVINLGFHEAGHLLLMPVGGFIMVLGGTLLQLLAPLILMLLFIYKNQDYFAASLALWWLGQSFMDCAPYINDSLALRLPLIGDNLHDWNYLLSHLGVIRYHHGIAITFDWIGVLVMIAASLWGGLLLFVQHHQVRYR